MNTPLTPEQLRTQIIEAARKVASTRCRIDGATALYRLADALEANAEQPPHVATEEEPNIKCQTDRLNEAGFQELFKVKKERDAFRAELNSIGDMLCAAGFPDENSDLWEDISKLAKERDTAIREYIEEKHNHELTSHECGRMETDRDEARAEIASHKLTISDMEKIIQTLEADRKAALQNLQDAEEELDDIRKRTGERMIAGQQGAVQGLINKLAAIYGKDAK